ncbi:WD40 repeat-like protein [Hysterangium stoloniferum]|nr:WD40 repeat-like protein [Hysterangium stoloniferum]
MAFLKPSGFSLPSVISPSENKKSQDIEVSSPPSDSVSTLAWSSQADFLAAGSWDSTVGLYVIDNAGNSQKRATYAHSGPVLGVCWAKDGTQVISGGEDNAAQLYDLQSGQSMQVAAHNAPIKCVKWIDAHGGLLATGSWDKSLKLWDLRSQNPVVTLELPERCYSMDVVFPLMVIGCASRKINVVDLKEPNKPSQTIESSLKMQTRTIACFPSADGFATGSVEGRVAITFLDEKARRNSDNYTFRCHRKEDPPPKKLNSYVFAVNDIKFHPIHGTFSTAGADGTISFWDKDSRTRLRGLEAAPAPISCTAFNRTGSILAYAVGYDWSKGYTGNKPGLANKIMLHACTDEEVKKRSKK